MSITMHSASVPIFVRMLSNINTWLDKAEAYAKEKGLTIRASETAAVSN